MRILLDECLPRRLRDHLSDHSVSTVSEMGWAGTTDSALLRMAAAEFQALITVDRGFLTDAREGTRGLTVILLRAPSNRLDDLVPLVPEVRKRLLSARPGELIRIAGDEIMPNG